MIKLNFLEKLLDGAQVEWKPLGEIGEFTRGKRFVKKDCFQMDSRVFIMAKCILIIVFGQIRLNHLLVKI